ncbi:hypothetical protein K4F52_002452 [Lecanicillium sp. MT-2017a]|nr:hypothetical protein K4F52_002452 [Lecanicillium sp. MT-2017a]
MGDAQVSRTTRIIELIHRICVLGPCFVAVIVAATSNYPGGYAIAFIFGGLSLLLDFGLVCKALWSFFMAPPVHSFNLIASAITIFIDLLLAALLIVAGVFAFRGLGPTFTDDYRKKYGGYDRRIAAGVLFLVSCVIQLIPLLMVASRTKRAYDAEREAKAKNHELN